MGRNDNIHSNLSDAADHAREAGHHAREAIDDIGREVADRLGYNNTIDDLKHGRFSDAASKTADAAKDVAGDLGIIDDRSSAEKAVDEWNAAASSFGKAARERGQDDRDERMDDNSDHAFTRADEHGDGASTRIGEYAREAKDRIKEASYAVKDELKDRMDNAKDGAKEESDRFSSTRIGEYVREAKDRIKEASHTVKDELKDRLDHVKDAAKEQSDRLSDKRESDNTPSEVAEPAITRAGEHTDAASTPPATGEYTSEMIHPFHESTTSPTEGAKESFADVKESISDKVDEIASDEHFTTEEFADHAFTQAGDHADASAIHYGEYAEQAEHDLHAFMDPSTPTIDFGKVKEEVIADLDDTSGDRYYDAAMLV